jgi:nitrogenase molybdenum-iron protein alpha/beta subunit
MKSKISTKTPFAQCSVCQVPGMLEILFTLKDVAVIIHSAAGCSSTFIHLNKVYQNELLKQNKPLKNVPCISANLSELDLIMGSTCYQGYSLSYRYKEYL